MFEVVSHPIKRPQKENDKSIDEYARRRRRSQAARVADLPTSLPILTQFLPGNEDTTFEVASYPMKGPQRGNGRKSVDERSPAKSSRTGGRSVHYPVSANSYPIPTG